MGKGTLKEQNSVNSKNFNVSFYNNYLNYFLVLYSLTFLCAPPSPPQSFFLFSVQVLW